MYGCNSGSTAGVMNGSRFFVLKTRWMSIDDKDWGMGVSLAFRIISRLQRLELLVIRFLGRWPRLLHFAPLALAIVNDYRREGFVRIIASGVSSATDPFGCALRAATTTRTSRHTAAVRFANEIDRAGGRPSRPLRRARRE